MTVPQCSDLRKHPRQRPEDAGTDLCDQGPRSTVPTVPALQRLCLAAPARPACLAANDEKVGTNVSARYPVLVTGQGNSGALVIVQDKSEAGFDYSPEGFDLDLAETARSLGLSERAGRGSPFLRTLNRAVGFGMAKLTGPEELSARRRVPPLSPRQLGRLSPGLQQRHAAWRTSHWQAGQAPTAGPAESVGGVQRGPAWRASQAQPASSPPLDAQLSRHARLSAGRAQGFGR